MITCLLQANIKTVKADGGELSNLIIIKVAIEHSQDVVGIGGSYGGTKDVWDQNINYSWIVNNTKYKIQTYVTNITTLQNLTELEKYNVFVTAGIQDEHFWLGAPILHEIDKIIIKYTDKIYISVDPNLIRQNLEQFVRNGSGYVGHCSSSEFPLALNHTYPNTLAETFVKNNQFFNMTKCNVTANAHIGFPIYDEHFSREALLNLIKHPRGMPEVTGQMAYLFESGTNFSNESHMFGGMPIDLIIRDKSHPILNGYFNDTLTVRYAAGPALKVSSDNINISRLMDYPNNVGFDNWSQIIAWRYPGLKIPSIKKFLSSCEDEDVTAMSGYFLGDEFPLGWLKDWDKKLKFPTSDTEIKYIDPELSNEHAMLAFNYPEGDETGGRVFLSALHPESKIWNKTGNYLYHMDEIDNNTLEKGLEAWKSENGTPGDVRNDYFLTKDDKIQTYVNAWLCRREVAWASKKVPDSDMPPVYGSSQVVDITPLIQENPEFTIKCCVLKRNNDTAWNTQNLSLWYKYNGANSSYQWTDWIYYDAIFSIPYRFIFDANEAMGCGIYQFCSTLNTTNATGYTYSESLPNPTYQGPDAWCAVGGSIISSFRFEPGTPFVNETTHFYSEALTQTNTHITNYNWKFGDDSNPMSGPNVKNVTHIYTTPGNYTINFTVTNNLSQKSSSYQNITVLNNLPKANFTINLTIAQVNNSINFTSLSYDSDGSIENYTWDFGDGTISYLQNPNHSYNSSNYYTVSLQVRDNANASNIMKKTNSILITDSVVDHTLLNDLPLEKKWKTIQNSINHSMTKDIIYVNDGTYHENITINKSLSLIGSNKENVILMGTVTMINPFDYELPIPYTDGTELVNGTELLMHFNNDAEVGENYLISNLVVDYSGQHHNGTRNGATYTTNTLKGAGCFSFDGINDQIQVDSIPALSGRNVTVSAWVYWTGGPENLYPILSQVNESRRGYQLGINTTTRKPFFQLDQSAAISSDALSLGWHNIVGKHNETKLSIYIDGEFKGSALKTGSGVSTDCYIGFDNDKYYFDGRIDEVTVWNRTLTGPGEMLLSSLDPEISALYRENYGAYLEEFTINSPYTIGVLPCNHSDIVDCELLNSSIGVLFNNVNDARIARCNISGGSIGVKINGSSPDDYNRIRLVDCYIDDTNHAIMVNGSENITLIRDLVNGSLSNLTFQNCNFSSMYISSSTSVNNVAPDTPDLSGPTVGDIGETYTYTACANDSNRDQLVYFFDWGDGNNTGWIMDLSGTAAEVRASHVWKTNGGYYVKVQARDVFNNESNWSQTILFKTETTPPEISSVSHSPDTVGFGYNVTIQANVTDHRYANDSGVKLVTVNISYPDSTYGNYTMSNTTGDTYEYLCNDTWLIGQFNYTIWAMDYAYNMNSDSGHHFHVSAQAMMSIATLKNSYSGTQYINITDPPNPPENLTLVGRGLTWNTYYNATSGQNILETYQGPVNYQEDNCTWTPINNTITQLGSNHPAYVYGYRNGNDHGLYGVYFKSNAQQEWPIAYTFNRSDDPTIHAVRSKLVGVGYVDPQSNWAYEYLQNVQSSQGQVGDYSITYPGVFTGTDVTWSYGNTGLKEEITMSNATKTILQSHPPSQYGLNDASSYLVFITKLEYQNLNFYNDSGLLEENVTISDIGVEFRDVLGQFKCALPLGEAYELNNESIRERLIYRIIHLNGNTYLLSGLKATKLNTMTFPVVIDPTIQQLQIGSLTDDGDISNYSTSYTTVQSAPAGTVSSSSTTIYIGQSKFLSFPNPIYHIYRGYLMFNTSSLPENAYITDAYISLYKHSDYSANDFTITVQNGQPTYPHIPLASTDYNKNYYSGNGGGLNTSGFVNGRNNIPLTNYSWLQKEGMTKFCLRSSKDINGTTSTATEYVIVYSRNGAPQYMPKLCITYRDQSKIKNSGSTDIKGYLLIQVQYYNTSQATWLLENDTVNETTPRTITSGSLLALDTIFNGLVRASDLTHGTGVTYRVYTAFRDPDGNILRTDDDVDLEAWWQFSKM